MKEVRNIQAHLVAELLETKHQSDGTDYSTKLSIRTLSLQSPRLAQSSRRYCSLSVA